MNCVIRIVLGDQTDGDYRDQIRGLRYARGIIVFNIKDIYKIYPALHHLLKEVFENTQGRFEDLYPAYSNTIPYETMEKRLPRALNLLTENCSRRVASRLGNMMRRFVRVCKEEEEGYLECCLIEANDVSRYCTAELEHLEPKFIKQR